MGQCCGQQVVPPNEKSAKYVLVLKIVMFIQSVVIILNFVAAKEFLREALFSLLFLCFLFIAYYKLSYQAMMMYVFHCIFFSVLYLIVILTPVQRQETPGQVYNLYQYSVGCISFVFYIFAAIFGFFPYREFKAIEFSENAAILAFIGDQAPQNRGTDERIQTAVDYGKEKELQGEKNDKPKTFDVFKGQGIRIG